MTLDTRNLSCDVARSLDTCNKWEVMTTTTMLKLRPVVSREPDLDRYEMPSIVGGPRSSSSSSTAIVPHAGALEANPRISKFLWALRSNTEGVEVREDRGTGEGFSALCAENAAIGGSWYWLNQGRR